MLFYRIRLILCQKWETERETYKSQMYLCLPCVPTVLSDKVSSYIHSAYASIVALSWSATHHNMSCAVPYKVEKWGNWKGYSNDLPKENDSEWTKVPLAAQHARYVYVTITFMLLRRCVLPSASGYKGHSILVTRSASDATWRSLTGVRFAG